MDYAKELCSYIDDSTSTFHAVKAAERLLQSCKATYLLEKDEWKDLVPGKIYYVIRDDASIVIFSPGTQLPEESGFAITGAHCDTPCLRARINKTVQAKGFERVSVEAYGGLIHSTWLDRPLSLAGRAVIKHNDSIESVLVDFKEAIAVIPNLAIHFNREMNNGVSYSIKENLQPIVASSGNSKYDEKFSWIIRAVAKKLGVKPEDVLSADLNFYEAFPAVIFGQNEELLSAPRIDNLEACHAIVKAFISSVNAKKSEHCRVVVLFDNEEVGSTSPRGASSSFLRDILERIVCASSNEKTIEKIGRALARSMNVSVDGAQGWHPAYADKCDDEYGPVINRGLAIKSNANVRYATDALGEAIIIACCERSGAAWQRFRMSPDLAAGTTIGPISSSLLGVRTVDVGVPMLAMHSIRELAGTKDHESMIKAITEFLSNKPDVM